MDFIQYTRRMNKNTLISIKVVTYIWYIYPHWAGKNIF